MAPIRIRSAGTKVATCVVGSVVILLLGLLLAGTVGSNGWAIALVGAVASVALVVFCARTFRGPDETDAPRPWWKMTGAPVWAFTFGALFLVSGPRAVQTPSDPAILAVVTNALIAIAFLVSAIVQTRHQRRERAPGA